MDIASATKEQVTAFWKFRHSIQDIIKEEHDDDRYLLKWLKARRFDAVKAEEMYRKSMQWRAQIGADTLLTEWDPPEVLKRYYAGGPGGYGKEGHLIWFDLASHMDFKGLLMSCKRSDIVKYEAYQIERARQIMQQHSEKLNKLVDQVIVIMDLSKLGLKHLAGPHLSVFNAIMEMTEANYPENLKTCYIINAPRIFPLAFNLAKPFLAPETRQKIVVLGSNYRDTLLQAIDPDQLPVAWGGTMTDLATGGPCPAQICLGGEVPQSYYCQGIENAEELTSTIEVERGKAKRLIFAVPEGDSLLRWEFTTEKYDIRFGVFLAPDSAQSPDEMDLDEMKSQIPMDKVNSHLVIQDGVIQCADPGTYVFVFDNKYSWINNKTVHYKIDVLCNTESNADDDLVTRDALNNEIIKDDDSDWNATLEDDQLETIAL